jgi:putative DNA primase/helicase
MDANDILRKSGPEVLRNAIDDGGDARPPAFSDEALALRFAEQYTDRLRYVEMWAKWFIFDGCWRPDETLKVVDLVRRVCLQVAKGAKSKLKLALASAKTVSAVERLARSDRRLAASVEQWDRDPWALNTPAGIVDLHTGDIRAARPDDYSTMITGVAPDPKCSITNWRRFLRTITGGDEEQVKYLQRVAGYCATALTTEHALIFLYGTGGNGKSTFINAITNCLGTYHRTAPIEAFIASREQRHPTELAALRGARLVVAQEMEQGRRWAEAKIKSLTGGDRIAARFMRQDFFYFVPVFKLLVAGNHKPSFRSVDEAIRRRLHLVPFSVRIPDSEVDGDLPAKLASEGPGILAWIIEGCVEWQKRGLSPPDAIKVATEEYLSEEDTIAAWIEERTELEISSTIHSSGGFYHDYKLWAEKSGEVPLRKRLFWQYLTENAERFKIKQARSNKVRGFVGRRIIPNEFTL